MPYLDLWAQINDGFIIHNLHIYALKMFEWHTGKAMFNMADISLSVICPDCKENILAVLTDGERNMTGRYQGLVTHLDNYPTKTLVQVWCGSYHIDLVMGEIFRIVVKDQFYYIMTSFIL